MYVKACVQHIVYSSGIIAFACESLRLLLAGLAVSVAASAKLPFTFAKVVGVEVVLSPAFIEA
ncbi:hypothetical protein NEIELOOT_01062, partial [Neisseria elongata subsp. glycolytica ATCC 29315]